VAPTSDQIDALLAGGQNDPTAAAVASGGELPPLALGTAAMGQPRQDADLRRGQWRTAQRRALSRGAEPAFPVLLLAPQGEGWGDFPLALVGRRLAVLDLSLRPGAPIGNVLSAFKLAGVPVGRVDVGRVAIAGAARARIWRWRPVRALSPAMPWR
jgi:hypothetical protein